MFIDLMLPDDRLDDYLTVMSVPTKGSAAPEEPWPPTVHWGAAGRRTSVLFTVRLFRGHLRLS